MADHQKLIRRIDETCNGLDVDHVSDGSLMPIKINGVKGRISKIDSPFLNVVGMADLDEENCEEVIKSAINRFKIENKDFGWLVGPTSKPVNICKHLIDNGFKEVPEISMSGMILDDLNAQISVNDAFEIRKVSGDEFDRNISLITRSFGMGLTEDVAKIVIKIYKSQGKNSYLYLSYARDTKKPVAFAASVIDKNNDVAILLGAGTLPEYRGKGIYSSLVARRLKDAKEAGVNAAIIQAVKNTSAPICEKLGFKTVCEINFYIYNL
ncbi:GNAT family N-acetyltransferase [Cuniculiplasma sp. SKW4]|uniref:GNAT family N-acetyltransferase n=1 Tax=Cuniculiplasma sp. SKW4 TaxID=3400171 RepID=UPI003FD0B36D